MIKIQSLKYIKYRAEWLNEANALDYVIMNVANAIERECGLKNLQYVKDNITYHFETHGPQLHFWGDLETEECVGPITDVK